MFTAIRGTRERKRERRWGEEGEEIKHKWMFAMYTTTWNEN